VNYNSIACQEIFVTSPPINMKTKDILFVEASGYAGNWVGSMSSAIIVPRELDEGIRPEFAPPRGARHPDLRRLRRRSCRRAATDGVPLPGCRAFGVDLRRTGRSLVCRA